MKNKGFTLIELMVVIAIIGVLFSVAMPEYRSYVLESQRKDTQGKLLQMLELQERFYVDNFTYTTTLDGDPAVQGDGLDYATDPVIINYGGDAAFSISAALCNNVAIYPDAPGINRCFRLIATPIDSQTQDGGMVIDNRGRKIFDFASVIPRDWNDNDLPAGACPECPAFPPAYE